MKKNREEMYQNMLIVAINFCGLVIDEFYFLTYSFVMYTFTTINTHYFTN